MLAGVSAVGGGRGRLADPAPGERKRRQWRMAGAAVADPGGRGLVCSRKSGCRASSLAKNFRL